jgi:hypothetical protein
MFIKNILVKVLKNSKIMKRKLMFAVEYRTTIDENHTFEIFETREKADRFIKHVGIASLELFTADFDTESLYIEDGEWNYNDSATLMENTVILIPYKRIHKIRRMVDAIGCISTSELEYSPVINIIENNHSILAESFNHDTVDAVTYVNEIETGRETIEYESLKNKTLIEIEKLLESSLEWTVKVFEFEIFASFNKIDNWKHIEYAADINILNTTMIDYQHAFKNLKFNFTAYNSKQN